MSDVSVTFLDQKPLNVKVVIVDGDRQCMVIFVVKICSTLIQSLNDFKVATFDGPDQSVLVSGTHVGVFFWLRNPKSLLDFDTFRTA